MPGFIRIDDATVGDTVGLLRSDRSIQWFTVVAAAAGGVTSFNARTGAVLPALNDYAASLVQNDSGVPGADVQDALNALGPSEAKAVAALTDADVTIATTTRQALLANTLTAPRQATITPNAVPGKTFALDMGTQTQPYTIAGGGPQLGTQIIAAGGPRRLLLMSDGSNLVFPITIVDLGQEPTLA